MNESFNILELQIDEEALDSYSVGDRLDLDNDGEDELILYVRKIFRCRQCSRKLHFGNGR